MPLSRQTLESLYQTMVRIRRFDERTVELFNSGQVKGTAHSYVGQEAVATGACAHLTRDDSVISNHRGHGHCIAKGARLDFMMAELMGREDGYCRGLGGSMHIAALDLNMLGANGIVAAGVPIGAGAALANKLRKADRVVISFFGDGGANQGVVHETMNLAAVWKLPFIFVCENNKYALSTDQSRTTAGEGVSARARAYGIPAARVDGNDLLAVHEAVGEGAAWRPSPIAGAATACAPICPSTVRSRRSSSGSRRIPWRAWSGASWTWERASSRSRSCGCAWRVSSMLRWPTGARAPSPPWR
jgi:2-oxoisovalerate dehydrogenase E1 component